MKNSFLNANYIGFFLKTFPSSWKLTFFLPKSLWKYPKVMKLIRSSLHFWGPSVLGNHVLVTFFFTNTSCVDILTLYHFSGETRDWERRKCTLQKSLCSLETLLLKNFIYQVQSALLPGPPKSEKKAFKRGPFLKREFQTFIPIFCPDWEESHAGTFSNSKKA